MYTSDNCQNDDFISCPYGTVDGACRNVDIDATPVSVALGSLEITTWGWRKLRATSTTSMTHPRVTVHPFTGGRTTQWVTVDTFSSKTISVTIGPNDGPQKTVAPSSSIISSGNGANLVIQCPNIITKNERTNSDYKNANDKFSVSVSSTNQLTVTRTDNTKSWSMNLQFECTVKSEGLINLGEKYIFDSSTKEIIVDFPPGDDSTLSISTSVNMKYRRWWHGHNTNKIAMTAGLNNKVKREFSYFPKLDVIRWSEDKEELIAPLCSILKLLPNDENNAKINYGENMRACFDPSGFNLWSKHEWKSSIGGYNAISSGVNPYLSVDDKGAAGARVKQPFVAGSYQSKLSFGQIKG